ncbi:MAG: hypothetical protein M1819_002063, partial [Sarea resinae]
PDFLSEAIDSLLAERTPLQASVPAMLLPLCLPSPFLEPLSHLADSALPFEPVECLLDDSLLPLRFGLAGLPLGQALAASIAPRRCALVDLATPHPLSVKVAAHNLPPAALSGDKFPHRLLVDSTLHDSRRCELAGLYKHNSIHVLASAPGPA